MFELLRNTGMKQRLAWVLVVLLSAAWGVPLWLVVPLALVPFAAPALRSLRRRARRRPTVLLHGTVEPPTERHAYKPPTTVPALLAALELAQAGAVEPRADGANVTLKEGGWASFTAALPERVTQSTLALQGTSVAALALLCDALARELGPMRLDVDGVQVVIDGTRPHGLLLRDVSQAMEARVRRPPPPSKSPPPGLLH
ncbi:MAG: hypothetical protein IT380_02280 [Myxococcales bacterium]|nr:hypothetical protein [Myxococcales bacterium]